MRCSSRPGLVRRSLPRSAARTIRPLKGGARVLARHARPRPPSAQVGRCNAAPPADRAAASVGLGVAVSVRRRRRVFERRWVVTRGHRLVVASGTRGARPQFTVPPAASAPSRRSVLRGTVVLGWQTQRCCSRQTVPGAPRTESIHATTRQPSGAVQHVGPVGSGRQSALQPHWVGRTRRHRQVSGAVQLPQIDRAERIRPGAVLTSSVPQGTSSRGWQSALTRRVSPGLSVGHVSAGAFRHPQPIGQRTGGNTRFCAAHSRRDAGVAASAGILRKPPARAP